MNVYFVIGIGWLSFVAGLAYQSIGETSPGATFDWTIVPIILVPTVFTWFIGFLGGKYWNN